MSEHDIKIVATVIGSAITFGLPVVWALSWAVRDGQFDNLERDSLSIFDADEPVGTATEATFAEPWDGRSDDE